MKQWQKALEQLCSPERPIWIPELRNDIELYIKAQDKTLQQQAETIERLKALLSELANDAETEYEAKYYGMLNHPSMKRSYDRDMDVVNRAKSEINKLEAGEL